MLLSFVLATAFQSETTIRDGLIIGGISRGGRRPVTRDAINDAICERTFASPNEGDVVSFEGKDRKWQAIQANKEGWFEDNRLAGGYVFSTIESSEEKLALLQVSGDGLVYVNGALRAGDPYGYGYLRLPIRLRKGTNTFLFQVGRGRLLAKLLPLTKSFEFDLGDTTLPDLIPTDKKPIWAGIEVRSASNELHNPLEVVASAPTAKALTSKIDLSSLTVRKVQVQLPIPKKISGNEVEYKLELKRNGAVIDSTVVKVRVRKLTEHYRRTFISGIDGSVQYFAVSPALKPDPSNALLLTVHGASVEAQGQAQAYKPKDWVTTVAATNRRPYGFDWEDIGRQDALEVLAQAKKMFPHDPKRVSLTGHSMGGHGTWSIGTLYPNLFASISPSAGWVSFWSYAGGWNPEYDLTTEKLLRSAANTSDTLARINNTKAQGVYILHGDADDNVPVTEARTMKAALEGIHHPDLGYHEEKGAGHWWGDQCVDWPGIFNLVARRKLDSNPANIDFTTPNPAVSATMGWATIEQQLTPVSVSRIQLEKKGDEVTGSTENVQALTLEAPLKSVTLDGQKVDVNGKSTLQKLDGTWLVKPLKVTDKSARRSGPFKMVYNQNLVLVVGTKGSKEENQWALDRARYDSETYLVRGNGSVDVMTDDEFAARNPHRNAILYGNANTNSAWKKNVGEVSIENGSIILGIKKITELGVGGIILAPNKRYSDCLIGLVGGTDLVGMRSTDRQGYFSAGIAFADWTFYKRSSPAGIYGVGFYDNQWKLAKAEQAWANPSDK